MSENSDSDWTHISESEDPDFDPATALKEHVETADGQCSIVDSQKEDNCSPVTQTTTILDCDIMEFCPPQDDDGHVDANNGFFCDVGDISHFECFTAGDIDSINLYQESAEVPSLQNEDNEAAPKAMKRDRAKKARRKVPSTMRMFMEQFIVCMLSSTLLAYFGLEPSSLFMNNNEYSISERLGNIEFVLSTCIVNQNVEAEANGDFLQPQICMDADHVHQKFIRDKLMDNKTEDFLFKAQLSLRKGEEGPDVKWPAGPYKGKSIGVRRMIRQLEYIGVLSPLVFEDRKQGLKETRVKILVKKACQEAVYEGSSTNIVWHFQEFMKNSLFFLLAKKLSNVFL